jgi:hypothetical protein
VPMMMTVVGALIIHNAQHKTRMVDMISMRKEHVLGSIVILMMATVKLVLPRQTAA